MNYHPLIISAPHACATVSDKIKNRLNLTDYQIWKFSDPFTKETSFYPKAFFHNIGNIHRLCCDLSDGTLPDRPFRVYDFYGNLIYKKGKEFSKKERQYFLDNFAKQFRENIINAISELAKKGYKKILIIDHHNTASDHLAGQTGEYMPIITVCNGGAKNTGKHIKNEIISCPPKFLKTFKQTFENSLGLPTEINCVYKMSNTIRWLVKSVRPRFPKIELYGIFLEYNLSLIHNPITKTNDLQARDIIHKTINLGIDAIFEKWF